ncbi:hypothetical protein [Nonomuraea lactucae]|nr:hypothetical protein [Nonomuraea lactucae]
MTADERDHLLLLCGHRTPHRWLRGDHVNPGLMRVPNRLREPPRR